MKTLLQRIKSALQSDATVSTCVSGSSIQIISPDLIPEVAITTVPFIGIAPITTSEAWVSTGMQDSTHMVNIYVCQSLEIQEEAIIGDSSSGKKGLLELISYISSVVRAKFFASGNVNYLSKPSMITGIRYSTSPYGDDVYVFVGTITLQCVVQSNVTTA